MSPITGKAKPHKPKGEKKKKEEKVLPTVIEITIETPDESQVTLKVAMKCRDRLHELVKEEIEKKDSSTEEWKIAMESSFNRMDNECFNVHLVGPFGKRCSERVKVLQHPYDPTDDYEFDTTVYDDDEDSFDDEYPSGFSEIDFLSDVDNVYEFSGGGSDYSDYGELFFDDY